MRLRPLLLTAVPVLALSCRAVFGLDDYKEATTETAASQATTLSGGGGGDTSGGGTGASAGTGGIAVMCETEAQCEGVGEPGECGTECRKGICEPFQPTSTACTDGVCDGAGRCATGEQLSGRGFNGPGDERGTAIVVADGAVFVGGSYTSAGFEMLELPALAPPDPDDLAMSYVARLALNTLNPETALVLPAFGMTHGR